MKKIILAVMLMLLSFCLMLSIIGCEESKILQCDGCGKEVEVEESSNMEDDWIVFCEECSEDLE